MKTIAVIIVNWNGGVDTVACLSSLISSSVKNCRISIYVVDNASDDDSLNRIRAFMSFYKRGITIKLIANKENRGFAGGNNDGIKKALQDKCDYIVLLNNDTLVETNFVGKFNDFFSQNKRIDIIGPKIYFAKGYEYHLTRYKKDELGRVIWYAGGIIDWDNVYLSHRGVDEVDRGQYDIMEQTAFISGCCMGIRSRVFNDVGFFDERYFMYLEDSDWCMRAKKAGYQLWYVPTIYLWHKNAQSSGRPGSPLHVYYQTRNRLFFGFRYAPIYTKLALLKESMRLVRKSRIQQKAVFDFYMARFGSHSTLLTS